MVEIKVGQKWKATDWWKDVASEKTVEITAVEGEMVYYSPGMFSIVGGHDDAGLDTWEKRWELVEDVVENKFNIGDKVRTICDYSNLWKEGEEGVIQSDRTSDESYQVYFPGQDDWWWVEEAKLERIEEEVNDFDPVDNVNHPAHYTNDPSGVECIEITRHRSFNIGNAIKYLWRAGLKQDSNLSAQAKEIEDLKKAVFYIQDEIAKLES